MADQLAAFMSYARFDDQHEDGQLTAFRERLAAEIRVQTAEEFEIFQDRNIAWGQNWQQRIVEALDSVTLLLVIITPGFFRSPHCRAEAKQFLDRERQLGRNDLILPVYYISTPQIDDPGRRDADGLAATLAARQYADWRDLRFESATSPAARKAIAHLAARMRDTFWHLPAATPTPTPTPAPAPAPAPARESMPGAQAPGQAPQAASGRAAARTEPSAHYLDHAAEVGIEQFRQQLTEAEARAARAAREADELRQQLANFRKPGLPDASAVPFWDVLDPTEREVLRSAASMRTFAAGATIMEQGEPADYVLVILAGRASIRVSENGRERVLAERSRGQLIGERAALQVSIRSASVIALEMIWALAVQTKDFAAFISANPRILAFVQDQRHARGIEPLTGENCTVVLTDVVAFSAHKRTDSDRLTIRKALSSMIEAAIHDYSSVRSEDRGDGILIVIPPEVPTAKIMNQLLRVLPPALDQHNRSHRNPAQFQLRLSVNVGPVVSDEMGVSGEAIIVAARIVEAPAFKEAFIESTARLGIIVSPFVYDTVVRHDQDEDYVASYFPVPVEVKEYRATAWMMLMD